MGGADWVVRHSLRGPVHTKHSDGITITGGVVPYDDEGFLAVVAVDGPDLSYLHALPFSTKLEAEVDMFAQLSTLNDLSPVEMYRFADVVRAWPEPATNPYIIRYQFDKTAAITLDHYSTQPNLTVVDPARHGTGLAGAERRRKQNDSANWVDRAYFYDANSPPESGLANAYRYQAHIPSGVKIYDLGADPDKLKEQSHDDYGQANLSLVEKLIKDAGYFGFRNTAGPMPYALAVFYPLPVQLVSAPAQHAARVATIPPYRVGPQKDTFPGDTVKTQDPPPSNGAATDSFGDEKGLIAPPGARGEFVPGRPHGNIGVPMNPTSPTVNDTNRRRLDVIPPMFLPAASRLAITAKADYDVDNEEDPKDDDEGKQKGIEREFLNPKRSPDPQPVAPNPGTGGGTDLPPHAPEAESHAAPLPLVELNAPGEATRQRLYGITGTINPGMDTTENLKFYNLEPLIENPQTTQQMLQDLGYNVEYFSYDPERFRLPKLKAKGYGKDNVWIYDPEVEHGSFKDTEYTRAWRIFHEVGHGVTEHFMEQKYGPSRREGRLGMPSKSMRGAPPKQIEVDVRPLTLMEAQRAVEWEDTAFRAQQSLLSQYGVKIAPEDFAREYNVNIADALYRTLVGDFGDPGEYGYVPSDQPADLRQLLQLLEAQEKQIAMETGRQPTQGIDLSNWQPIPDAEIQKAMAQRMEARRRRAFSVYPTPQNQPLRDERLLLQIPSDVQDRYNDLHRRVSDYMKQIKLNSLDMFDFPQAPPEAWVEEERQNVPVDWKDDHVWNAYMGRLSHDDVANWIGLDGLDPDRRAELAPNLTTEYLLEGTDQDFSSWFRTRRPTVTDGNLLDYLKETAQTFPDHGLGKGYAGVWRKHHQTMVRDEASRLAKERHDRYLREVAYGEHVRPHQRDAFDAFSRFQKEPGALADMIEATHQLPLDDRDEVVQFQSDYDDMVSEGTHALDLHSEPISRDDRMCGDMTYMGEQFVPVRRIHGTRIPDAELTDAPIPLYRYGNAYYLMHESDEQFVNADVTMIRAQVYEIIPGSSIRKAATLTFEDWDRKARALEGAIREIQKGANREAVFSKWGREYGPGLRKAVSDYLYVGTLHKQSDGGGGSAGSATGDSTCSSFADQAPDNCDGCTFNSGTGGPEFGYGGCTLSHLFLNAPANGFGRGEQSPYSDTHVPGKPSVQPRQMNLTR